MKRTRAFVFAALVSLVALGVSGQPALAQQDDASRGNVHVTLTDHWSGANPEAGPAAVAGPVGFVLPPPSAGPPQSWPCVTPNAPCTSDPAGGLLMGLPLQQWPISGTTNCTLVPCGQIMALFETTTGKGAISFSVSIKQGTTTIFSGSFPNVGTAKPNQVGVVDVTGIQFSASAVAGAATVTVNTSVGATKLTNKTTIFLQ